MYSRNLHNMWSSTLSLNSMPSSACYSGQQYGLFRRSKSVRSLYDGGGEEEGESDRRQLRRVVLRRSADLGAGLGFSIRGGRELGLGIFVSKVVERSVADRAGLLPGDQILAVNDTSFEDISHEEAIKILKSAPRLAMLVCSTGRVPGSCVVHQTYTWLDSEGRTVSPPPEYDHSFYSSPAHRKAVSRLHSTPRIRKVSIRVEKGQSLGLMIRGGVEYGLGIYITGVDKNSVADLVNLKVGDQILEVNNQSFLDITHDEAVRVLKYSPHMVMTIREVGKVPYSCTTYDDTGWLTGKEGRLDTARSPRMLRKGEPSSLMSGRESVVHTIDMQALRILNEKAKLVLNKHELATLSYYRIEYERGQMTIDAFVAVLLELFETEEKYALLQDVREVIHPLDLHKFDEIIYKKDVEMARAVGYPAWSSLHPLLVGRGSWMGDSGGLTTVSPLLLRQQTRQSLGADDRSCHNRFSSVSMDHLTSHVATAHSPRATRRVETGRCGVNHPSDSSECYPTDLTTCVNHVQQESGRRPASRVGRRRGLGGHGYPPPHHHPSNPYSTTGDYEEDVRTPSEDSGVDLANGSYYSSSRAAMIAKESSGGRLANDQWQSNGGGGDRSIHRHHRPEEPIPTRRQGQPRRHVEMFDASGDPVPHPRRRSAERRWSVGSDRDEPSLPPEIAKDADTAQAEDRGSKEEKMPVGSSLVLPSPPPLPPPPPPEVLEETSQGKKTIANSRINLPIKKIPSSVRFQLNQRRTDIDEEGCLCLVIRKTKPLLGIAIEGGANTRQPLPRIINIQATGAAFEAGGLRVGHVIVSVDGKRLEGLDHQMAANVLSSAYANPLKQDLELVVTEIKRSPLELRRSSLAFLYDDYLEDSQRN